MRSHRSASNYLAAPLATRRGDGGRGFVATRGALPWLPDDDALTRFLVLVLAGGLPGARAVDPVEADSTLLPTLRTLNLTPLPMLSIVLVLSQRGPPATRGDVQQCTSLLPGSDDEGAGAGMPHDATGVPLRPFVTLRGRYRYALGGCFSAHHR